jgi:hypothetical protein
MRSRGSSALLLVAVGICLPTTSWAVQATLTRDSYTSTLAPNSINGWDASLHVVGSTEKAYIAFDLGPLPAGVAATDVAKATLTVWANKVATPGSVDVIRVTSAWIEATLVPSNAPTLGSVEATMQVKTANSYVTADVTALVQAWIGGSLANNGMALVAQATASVFLDSKEAATGHEPRLEITLKGVSVPHELTGHTNPGHALLTATTDLGDGIVGTSKSGAGVHAVNETGGVALRVDGQLLLLPKVVTGGNSPVASLRIDQPGPGVGIFLGDRPPFGQALLETDLKNPATHAWFAENGSRVFSVTSGGEGFFKGSLHVEGDASFKGGLNVEGDADMGSLVVDRGASIRPDGFFQMGNLAQGSTGELRIYGAPSPLPFPAATRFTILSDGNVGIGVTTPAEKLEVAGNVIINGLQKTSPAGPLFAGTALNVAGRVVITGDESFGAKPRQMINLWNTAYGIGVQDFAFYQRTGSDFFWYKDGEHRDTLGDAGGGTQLMHLDAAGELTIAGRLVTPVLQITGGADVAEPFKMSQLDIPKGAVVIIDDKRPGYLTLTEREYDRRVAGVVSGANGINTGIVLSQEAGAGGEQTVALTGRVYVLADASSGSIRPGDLLTTAAQPGYAMRAADYTAAKGAVIGKAMSALAEGRGLVLVLVSLQ